jgi:hypothetical protein
MPFVPNPDKDKIEKDGVLSLDRAVARAEGWGIKNREEYVNELQKDEDIMPWPSGPGGLAGYAKHHGMTPEQAGAVFQRIKAHGGPHRNMDRRERLAYEQWASKTPSGPLAKSIMADDTPRPELARPSNNKAMATASDVEKALAPAKRAQD